MSRERRLPQGRLGRMMSLARVGARTGASLIAEKSGERAAAQAAEVLGTLRGLAAKVGQMASYVDGFVPESHRDAYEKALKELRERAPTSSWADIQKQLEDELRAPVDELFAELDSEPFASASIGQVHRGVLHDGTEVAVKVQHVGIERAFEADLTNVAMLTRMVGAVGPKNMEVKRVMEEVRERFREELDYELEADHQEFFREFHADDPLIVIPRVIRSHSRRRVLTSELKSGVPLEEAAQASQKDREHFAEVLWRFVFRGNLVGGRFNADPHPGNYLFGSDGRITFLDFGCVQVIGEHHQRCARDMHRAAIANDLEGFRAAAKSMLKTVGGAYEEVALDYSRMCFAPLFDAPFHISREYVTNLVLTIQDMKKLVFARDKSFRQLPAGMILLNRLQFGFYSVLARLDVEQDYRRIERAFLTQASLL